MVAIGGEEAQLLLILDLGTSWGVCAQRLAPAALCPGERNPGTALPRVEIKISDRTSCFLLLFVTNLHTVRRIMYENSVYCNSLRTED
jgi:hypothetical protein